MLAGVQFVLLGFCRKHGGLLDSESAVIKTSLWILYYSFCP